MSFYGNKLRCVYIGALACIATLAVATQLYFGSLAATLATTCLALVLLGFLVSAVFESAIDTQTEAARVAAHNEFEELKQRFELAIEGSCDAIFDWNPASDEVWFSPRWLQLLNISEGALGTTIAHLLWHVAPEDSARLRHELDHFVASEDERFHSEFQLVDGNDAAVWVMMRAASFRDATGRVTRVCRFRR